MSNYIDANGLESYRLCSNPDEYALGWNDAITKIETNAPIADVAPIVHAHWIVIETGYLTCPNCTESFYVGGDVKSDTIAIAKSGEFKFCPHCGVKINKEIEQ